MDVRLTDEQEMLRDTAARLASAHAPASVHDLDEPARSSHADAAWAALAESGLLGLDVPESAGGMGATAFEIALVAEQLGGVTSPAPYLGQGVLAPALLAACGAVDELADVLAGVRRTTVALGTDLVSFASPATGAVAWDALGAHDALGIDAEGQVWCWHVVGDELAVLDRTRRAVALTSAPTALGAPVDAAARARIDALALAVVAADLVGVMQRTLDDTATYVAQRQQFGVPVGSFQAVQHLAADAKVLLEASRSSTWHGAWAVDARSGAEAELATRQAKAMASRSARTVVEIGVQLHGGVAITWEHTMHVAVRRALQGAAAFGDVGTQLRAIADRRLGPPEALATAGR